MMKTRMRSLEDISREKQKVKQEIALQELAVSLHYKEIKHKMSFASLSGYAFGLIKDHYIAKMPGFLSGILKGFISTSRKSKG